MMKVYWSIALLIGLLLGTFLFTGNSPVLDNKTELLTAENTCDLSTPRKAVRSFLYSVRSYNRDHYTGFDCLTKVVSSPEDMADDNKSEAVKKARDIFLVLENMNYDIDEDIPDNIQGNKADLHFSYEGQEFDVLMKKGIDGWHFSSTLFKNPAFMELVKKLRYKYAKFTSEKMEGDTFLQSLMSPYRTFFTLKSGVVRTNQDNLEAAISTLDMSRFTALEKPVYGPILAVMLYRIINSCSPLHLEELSASPDSEYAPVFMVVPEMGSITMHVVTLENGRKAWKFTPHSLQVVQTCYDDIMQDLLREGTDPFVGNELPLHMIIDDFVQRNYPQLMASYLNTNIYKWVALFALFLITPLALKIISFLLNKILTSVETKLPEGIIPPGRRKFILPVQMMVMGYLWLTMIGVLILYKDLMVFSLYGVKIIGTLSMVWIITITANLFCDVITAKGGSSIRATMMLIIAQIFKLAVILMGLAHIAQLFGQDSTRIFAAMGIGGLAIALAGKDTLENIFGTMVIMTTRPFAVGDWITFLGHDGTVEKVGVRSTSIRTFYNSEVIIPNAKFITTPVDNMGRREWRRYKTTIGVAYDTPAENLNGYVQGLKRLVMNHPNTRKTDFHIVVNDFGPSSIDIMVYIFFKTEDWAKELLVRHEFIVDALRLAEELKINIAFPTTTVHFRQDNPDNYPEFQSDAHAISEARSYANSIRPVKEK
ncbi:mechanosensitive ion channel family protein [Desulfovibrio sp. JC010]|uniref:mechanosensitive ion channel family protein n=1 Tax=Desulfovibrio sp. JC010 TaxID=2593641 RepID=UPI0013D73C8B|nr:mechanosensitive ion channel family protein [Desulfovibrio sp. JC010]NDV25425.1 mechanosensitive ion channel family protein [Desulfovibrio sp. JC010]